MFSGTGSPAPRARLAFLLACVSATPLLPAQAVAQTEPELPRVFLDTTPPPPPPSQLASPALQSAASVLWQDESESTSLHIMGVQASPPELAERSLLLDAVRVRRNRTTTRIARAPNTRSVSS